MFYGSIFSDKVFMRNENLKKKVCKANGQKYTLEKLHQIINAEEQRPELFYSTQGKAQAIFEILEKILAEPEIKRVKLLIINEMNYNCLFYFALGNFTDSEF